jgi:DNA-binding transcriptional LysR family regulator
VVLDARREWPGFLSEILRHEAIRVVAPADHPLAVERQVAPSDLRDETILLPEAPESGCEYRGQFESQLARDGISLEGALEFASIETVKQCVIAGMGVSVMPAVAVEADMLAERLVALEWRDSFAVYTQIVWNARRSISPAQAAFIQTARTVLGEDGRRLAT